ncbi:ankyrin repeat-containing domain protein [Aspergillus desertorum]
MAGIRAGKSRRQPPLSQKLKINAATTIGTTALIKAASNGQARIVRALLQKGADLSLENWYGNALHCAAEDGHSNTIRQLVSSGMSPNVRSRIGRHPLDCTLDRDSADAFETLLDLGAKIKKRKSNVPLLVKATF